MGTGGIAGPALSTALTRRGVLFCVEWGMGGGSAAGAAVGGGEGEGSACGRCGWGVSPRPEDTGRL